jgi:hypothetical protein
MMVNCHRGEIAAQMGGAERRLCLTLGALAGLEAEFAVSDLNGLAERFSTGRLSANDLIAILHAGLRGGGHDFSRAEVEDLHVEGGVAAYADIVARLLAATFGAPENDG